MSTSERFFLIATFSLPVDGWFFSQVHNIDQTRVLHETGLYPTEKWAEHAAEEWATKSKSQLAKSLEQTVPF